jgi:hypothetical protein
MNTEITLSRNLIEENDQIKLFDSLDNLDIFCYLKCSDDSDDLVKQTRGVVFSGDNLIKKSFPYNYEFVVPDDLEKIKNIDFSDSKIFYSYEGALIHVFYYNNKWYITTNKKLDAFKSKWSSEESFGILFTDAVRFQFENNEKIKNLFDENSFKNIETKNGYEFLTDIFNVILQKEKQYVFLVLNNKDTRIVCNEPDHAKIYHIGTFIDNELNLDENIGISHPEEFTSNDLNDIIQEVSSIDYLKQQGLIVFTKDGKQIKLLNDTYKKFYDVRGNEPHKLFRYFQIRTIPEKVELFKELYPSFIKDIEDTEAKIYELTHFIHQSYITRYIKKEYIVIPQENYLIMNKCHEWHNKNRDLNKIHFDKVGEILNEFNPTFLYKMITKKK